jgi:hypothetical protein
MPCWAWDWGLHWLKPCVIMGMFGKRHRLRAACVTHSAGELGGKEQRQPKRLYTPANCKRPYASTSLLDLPSRNARAAWHLLKLLNS